MAPPRWHRIFNVVGTLLLTAILVPVVLASARVVSLLFEFEQRSDALHLPRGSRSVVPVALAMIIVMSLVRLFVHAPGEKAAPRDPMGRDGGRWRRSRSFACRSPCSASACRSSPP